MVVYFSNVLRNCTLQYPQQNASNSCVEYTYNTLQAIVGIGKAYKVCGCKEALVLDSMFTTST